MNDYNTVPALGSESMMTACKLAANITLSDTYLPMLILYDIESRTHCRGIEIQYQTLLESPFYLVMRWLKCQKPSNSIGYCVEVTPVILFVLMT